MNWLEAPGRFKKVREAGTKDILTSFRVISRCGKTQQVPDYSVDRYRLLSVQPASFNLIYLSDMFYFIIVLVRSVHTCYRVFIQVPHQAGHKLANTSKSTRQCPQHLPAYLQQKSWKTFKIRKKLTNTYGTFPEQIRENSLDCLTKPFTRPLLPAYS